MAKPSHKTWTPSDLSLLALLLFAIAQVFSYKLISGSRNQIYIQENRNYMASYNYIGSTGSRNSSSKYRLRFEMTINSGIVSCDVVKLVDIPAAPILSNHVRVTPRPYTCDDPYLTDLEFWPHFDAWIGFGFTAFGGGLLVASARWHRRLVMEALAKKSLDSATRPSTAATNH